MTIDHQSVSDEHVANIRAAAQKGGTAHDLRKRIRQSIWRASMVAVIEGDNEYQIFVCLGAERDQINLSVSKPH